MADPTPAQIEKAREIAEQVRERAIDFSLGTDLGQHLLSDPDAVSAIAAALADEAQHTVKLETHQLAMKLGERAFRERDEARQQLADARAIADTRAFYELMQQYRHAPLTDQGAVIAAYDAVALYVAELWDDAEQRGRQAGLREAAEHGDALMWDKRPGDVARCRGCSSTKAERLDQHTSTCYVAAYLCQLAEEGPSRWTLRQHPRTAREQRTKRGPIRR